jgi:hypothetical protein
MNKWFSEKMTSAEARHKLFSLLDGKTAEEREEINKEYQAVMPAINKRELERAAKGWLC